MRPSYLLCGLLVLSGCSASPPRSARTAPERCYASTDGLRYNSFALQLNPDASYVFTLNGDVGRWGEASGTWEQKDSAIVLHEASNDGYVKFPSVLKILGDGSLKLDYHGRYYSEGGTNLLPIKCVR